METSQQNQAEETKLQKSYNPIYDSMITWNVYRNSEPEVDGWLNQGNMFEFTIDMGTSPYLHAYPGVYDGKMVFQLITSGNDVMANFSAEVVPSNVVTVNVSTKPMPLGGEIDPAKAIERVGNWNNSTIREEWIENTTSIGMMYQAFVIPGDDIVSNQKHGAYYALKAGAEDDYIADLIIVNLESGKVVYLGTVYFDMTRPVPPYKPSGETMKANFGLLNFIETLM